MIKYFFILGNNPSLSIAELTAIFPHAAASIANQQTLILDLAEKIDARRQIAILGGTIKIGKIFNQLEGVNLAKIISAVSDEIDKNKIRGKFKFGLSFYGKGKINLRKLGMELKNNLKDSGIISRWVTCRGESRFAQSLSSVVVEQNKLTDKGLEVVLIKADNKLLIGKTLAVQPFKQLSFRDYGRPARDDYSGMLPPKLAQIMINLALPHPTPSLISPLPRGRKEAGVNEVILDPFCGSGTILTEALLMGYKNLIGSDISAKAMADTKQNMEWIVTNYKLSRFARSGEARQIIPQMRDPAKAVANYKLFNINVLQISKHIKPISVDAIITEPYLGPQRGKINFHNLIPELEKLYSISLKEFAKVLKPDGRVVMIWPIFHSGNQLINLSPDLNNLKIINPIPLTLKNNPIIKLTARGTIIYGRPRQKVWREIVILK